jgi:hypothetical protein
MATDINVTKQQLIKMIEELKNQPNDKVRILGDAGVSLVGAGLGAAAAGTLASAAGATSIAGVTTVAGWLGIAAVATTPVGWIIGAAAAGGAVAYGISRLIHGGGLSEGRKKELLLKYKEDAKAIEAKEIAGSITDQDKTIFIVSIRELIQTNAITPEKAKDLIEYVENGRIPISQALTLIQGLLTEKQSSVKSA